MSGIPTFFNIPTFQFIDHDMSLTEGGAGFGEANISIPTRSDDFFFQEGCPNIHFTRSRFVNNTIREQVNEITGKRPYTVLSH